MYRDDDLAMLQRIARAVVAGQRAEDAIRGLQESGPNSQACLSRATLANRIHKAVAHLQSDEVVRQYEAMSVVSCKTGNATS
jgi:hypothetical protein